MDFSIQHGDFLFFVKLLEGMYGKSMDMSILNGKKVDHEQQSVKEKVSIAMSNCNRVICNDVPWLAIS